MRKLWFVSIVCAMACATAVCAMPVSSVMKSGRDSSGYTKLAATNFLVDENGLPRLSGQQARQVSRDSSTPSGRIMEPQDGNPSICTEEIQVRKEGLFGYVSYDPEIRSCRSCSEASYPMKGLPDAAVGIANKCTDWKGTFYCYIACDQANGYIHSGCKCVRDCKGFDYTLAEIPAGCLVDSCASEEGTKYKCVDCDSENGWKPDGQGACKPKKCSDKYLEKKEGSPCEVFNESDVCQEHVLAADGVKFFTVNKYSCQKCNEGWYLKDGFCDINTCDTSVYNLESCPDNADCDHCFSGEHKKVYRFKECYIGYVFKDKKCVASSCTKDAYPYEGEAQKPTKSCKPEAIKECSVSVSLPGRELLDFGLADPYVREDAEGRSSFLLGERQVQQLSPTRTDAVAQIVRYACDDCKQGWHKEGSLCVEDVCDVSYNLRNSAKCPDNAKCEDCYEGEKVVRKIVACINSNDYELNEDGTDCIKKCGEHQHRENGICKCDNGWILLPSGQCEQTGTCDISLYPSLKKPENCKEEAITTCSEWALLADGDNGLKLKDDRDPANDSKTTGDLLLDLSEKSPAKITVYGCKDCKEGYELVEGRAECQAKDCTGFDLDSCPSKGVCSPCQSGDNAPKQKLTGCTDGLIPNNEGTECVSTCEYTNSEGVPNCAEGQEQTCTRDGKTWYSGQCNKCVSEAYDLSTDGTACNKHECGSDYTLKNLTECPSDATCETCPTGEDTMWKLTGCSSSNYVLVLNEEKNACVCDSGIYPHSEGVPNCAEGQEQTCTRDGKTWYSGQCKECVSEAYDLSADGTACNKHECGSDYTLKNLTECPSNATCETCPTGEDTMWKLTGCSSSDYVLNEEKNACVCDSGIYPYTDTMNKKDKKVLDETCSEIIKCNDSRKANGRRSGVVDPFAFGCKVCKVGYHKILKDGVEINMCEADVCDPSYDVSEEEKDPNAKYESCPSGATTMYKFVGCDTEKGYEEWNGKCVPACNAEEHQVRNDKGKCVCDEGYTFDEKAQKCVDKCLTMYSNDKAIEHCQEGEEAWCSLLNGTGNRYSGKCNACVEGYAPNKEKTACIKSCGAHQTYSAATGTCVCVGSYVFSSDKTECIDPCQYSNEKAIENCGDRKEDKCTLLSNTSAHRYSGICTECKLGYDLVDGGTKCEKHKCDGYTLSKCPEGMNCTECKSGDAEPVFKLSDCKEGYDEWNGNCVAKCQENEVRNEKTGVCEWHTPDHAVAFTVTFPRAKEFLIIQTRGEAIIAWGDGTVDKTTSAQTRHDYAKKGTYNVYITGTPTKFNVTPKKYITKLLDISLPSITDYTMAFDGASSMKGNLTDMKFPSNLERAGSMFSGCERLEGKIPTLPDSIYEASDMFASCKGLEGPFPNIPTSLVDGARMFRNCIGLRGAIPSSITKSSLVDGSYMFSGCLGLIGGPVEKLPNTLENGTGMFLECENLHKPASTTLKLPKSLVNGQDMFNGCSRLEARLSILPTNLTNLTNGVRMFYNSGVTGTISALPASLTDGESMFARCKNLKRLNLSSYPSKLINAASMFYNTPDLQGTCPNRPSSLRYYNEMFGSSGVTCDYGK